MFLLQQSSIASESRNTEHQSLLWARNRGREKRRVERRQEFTVSGPYRESFLEKEKRQGLREREMLKSGLKKERVLLLQRKEHELDSLIKEVVSRQHDRFPLQTTIITTGVVAS